MPFVLPTEVVMKLPISRFKTIEDSPEFYLQKRKKSFRTRERYIYRIVTRTKSNGHRFMIAIENNYENIRMNEWKYVCEVLPAILDERMKIASNSTATNATQQNVNLTNNTSDASTFNSSNMNTNTADNIAHQNLNSNSNDSSHNTTPTSKAPSTPPLSRDDEAYERGRLKLIVEHIRMIVQQQQDRSKRRSKSTTIPSGASPNTGPELHEKDRLIHDLENVHENEVLNETFYDGSDENDVGVSPELPNSSLNNLHHPPYPYHYSYPNYHSHSRAHRYARTHPTAMPYQNGYYPPIVSPQHFHMSMPIWEHQGCRCPQCTQYFMEMEDDSGATSEGDHEEEDPATLKSTGSSSRNNNSTTSSLHRRHLNRSVSSAPRPSNSFIAPHLPVKPAHERMLSSPATLHSYPPSHPPCLYCEEVYQSTMNMNNSYSFQTPSMATSSTPPPSNNDLVSHRTLIAYMVAGNLVLAGMSADARLFFVGTLLFNIAATLFILKLRNKNAPVKSPSSQFTQINSSAPSQLRSPSALLSPTSPFTSSLSSPVVSASSSRSDLRKLSREDASPRDISSAPSDSLSLSDPLIQDLDIQNASINLLYENPSSPSQSSSANNGDVTSQSLLSLPQSTVNGRPHSSSGSIPLIDSFLPEMEEFTTSMYASSTDAIEKMPLNAWANTDATTFSVRIGPHYSRNKRKEPSRPAIYDCIGVDLVSCERKVDHIGRFKVLPKCGLGEDDLNDGYIPTRFIVNCQIPTYAPETPLFGKNPENGEGYGLVFYYVINEETRNVLRARRQRIADGIVATPYSVTLDKDSEGEHRNLYNKEDLDKWAKDDDEDLSPSLRLLHRFCYADTPSNVERHSLRNRFKAIARLVNTEDSGLAGYIKGIIYKYNGTPFIVRTSSTFYHDSGMHYFEVGVDVHRFGYPARAGLHNLKDRLKDIVFDWAFVIEGHSDYELPEQILSSVRLSKLDVTAAKEFRDHLKMQ